MNISIKTSQSSLRAQSIRRRLFLIFALLIGLIFISFAALIIGAKDLHMMQVWQAIINPMAKDQTTIVIYDLRLPRLYVGIFVGICLAVSGLLIQNVTNNIFAEPGVLGLNAGASLFVVIGVQTLDLTNPIALGWCALCGAGMAMLFVMTLGFAGSGRTSPLRLILIGSAISAIFVTITSSILFVSEETANVFRHWVVGSIAAGSNTRANQLIMLMPFFVLGMSIAIVALRGLNIMLLGEENARALGVNTVRIRFMTTLAVVLLSAVATSIAGPIGFLGLVAPYLARRIIGSSLWGQFYVCLLVGPSILLLGDILGRVVLTSGEFPAGVTMVFIGAPIFIILIRETKVLSI